MHNSDSGIGINSGMIPLLTGIGIKHLQKLIEAWNQNQNCNKPGIGIGIKTLPESCITEWYIVGTTALPVIGRIWHISSLQSIALFIINGTHNHNFQCIPWLVILLGKANESQVLYLKGTGGLNIDASSNEQTRFTQLDRACKWKNHTESVKNTNIISDW